MINLIGKPLNIKENIKPEQLFIKDKYLISNNQRKDSIPQEKEFNDLAITGKKGSWTTYIGDFGANKNFQRAAYAYKYFKRLKIIDTVKLAN